MSALLAIPAEPSLRWLLVAAVVMFLGAVLPIFIHKLPAIIQAYANYRAILLRERLLTPPKSGEGEEP